MGDPIDPAAVIARALTPVRGIEPVDAQRAMAAAILAALDAAGCVVLAPQDIEWGECPGDDDSGPHRVSLSLCSGCLEYDPE